jgi:SAM-dependent methyltransferase
VLLWGTGSLGQFALDRLRDTVVFAAAIDNSLARPVGPWRGLKVMTAADALVEGSPRPYVIVATMFLADVMPELERRGYRHDVDWCHAEEAMTGLCPGALADQLTEWRGQLAAARRLTFHDLAVLSDDFWLWLNVQPPGDPVTAGLVAPLPPADVQECLTGFAGSVSVAHGFNQYRIMKGLAERAGIDFATARQILDFGCGYARILRFFTRDSPDATFVGVDVSEMLIDWCRTHLPFGRWSVVPSLPPTRLPADECSLIVAFSVFTHLSEASQALWLEELHRWLEPGGVALVTLWTDPSKSIDYHRPHFPDWAGLTADFEAGRFCYSNRCYGETSTYGEAFVPRRYVERCWTRWFDVVEWLADDPRSPSQTHVALRKR